MVTHDRRLQADSPSHNALSRDTSDAQAQQLDTFRARAGSPGVGTPSERQRLTVPYRHFGDTRIGLADLLLWGVVRLPPGQMAAGSDARQRRVLSCSASAEHQPVDAATDPAHDAAEALDERTGGRSSITWAVLQTTRRRPRTRARSLPRPTSPSRARREVGGAECFGVDLRLAVATTTASLVGSPSSVTVSGAELLLLKVWKMSV